jgi:ferredoxin
MSLRLEVHIESARCTRCGACSALSPSLFDVSAEECRILRQPSTAEQRAVEAARWICPTDAVRVRASEAEDSVAEEHEPGARLFDELATGAESVRWTLAALPWDELDPGLASAGLRRVVREMAFSENATYSATQRFLDAFGDDVDFSRWLAVWFYEETRHPYVLLEWLRRVGEPIERDFVLKARVSTPLMRSQLGTLVTNVISEVTAAQAYRYLARTSPEPVLGGIAARVAGDEARHAASFFRFARQRVEATEGVAVRERARGLEVLRAWLDGTQRVTHPVQQMIARLDGAPTEGSFDLDFGSIALRVVRVIGLLLDVPLSRVEDVTPALHETLARRS